MFNNLDEVLRFIKQNIPKPDTRVTTKQALDSIYQKRALPTKKNDCQNLLNKYKYNSVLDPIKPKYTGLFGAIQIAEYWVFESAIHGEIRTVYTFSKPDYVLYLVDYHRFKMAANWLMTQTNHDQSNNTDIQGEYYDKAQYNQICQTLNQYC